MKRDKLSRENGSAMLLVLIVTAVLSAIVASSIKVSSKEMESSQHNFLKKQAYFIAQKGIEAARNEIEKTEDQGAVTAYSRTFDQTKQQYSSITGYDFEGGYITGSFEVFDKHMREGDPPSNLNKFPSEMEGGWDPPMVKGYNLNNQSQSSLKSVVWEVRVSAKTTSGKKHGYAEITAGIMDVYSTTY